MWCGFAFVYTFERKKERTAQTVLHIRNYQTEEGEDFIFSTIAYTTWTKVVKCEETKVVKRILF